MTAVLTTSIYIFRELSCRFSDIQTRSHINTERAYTRYL